MADGQPPPRVSAVSTSSAGTEVRSQASAPSSPNKAALVCPSLDRFKTVADLDRLTC
jgi:hypothetical protein